MTTNPEIKHLCVRNVMIEVTAEVYKTYYQERNKEKYQLKRDAKQGLVYYNNLDRDDMLGIELFADKKQLSVEATVLQNERHAELRHHMGGLKKAEQDLLHALFFEQLTHREYSDRTGVPTTTIASRKKVILGKLKKNLSHI